MTFHITLKWQLFVGTVYVSLVCCCDYKICWFFRYVTKFACKNIVTLIYSLLEFCLRWSVLNYCAYNLPTSYSTTYKRGCAATHRIISAQQETPGIIQQNSQVTAIHGPFVTPILVDVLIYGWLWKYETIAMLRLVSCGLKTTPTSYCYCTCKRYFVCLLVAHSPPVRVCHRVDSEWVYVELL